MRMKEKGSFGARVYWMQSEHGKGATTFEEMYAYQV